MTSHRKNVRAVSLAKMLEVLPLIAEGYTDGRIARMLHVTEDTVKGRCRALYHDLGALNRAHAVAIGYQRGYVGLGQHAPSCSLRQPQVCDCEVSG